MLPFPRSAFAGATVGVVLAVAVAGAAHADEHHGDSGQVTVDPVHPWSRTEPPKVRMDAEYGLRSSSPGSTAGSDRSGSATAASSSNSRPSGPVCTFEPISNVAGHTGDDVVKALDAAFPDMYIGSRGGDESQAFSMRCAGTGGGWVIGDGAGGPGSGPGGGTGAVVLPSPAELAERARQTLVLPLPTPGMSPKARLEDGRSATLVNENTWIWTDPDDWTTRSERVQVGPVWAEVTARPKQIRFDSGMGQRITCDGPGTPYDRSYGMHAASPDCGLVFPRSTYGMPGEQTTGEYAITWSVSWRGSTGATDEGGELPDMISRTTESFAVAEAQSLRAN